MTLFSNQRNSIFKSMINIHDIIVNWIQCKKSEFTWIKRCDWEVIRKNLL